MADSMLSNRSWLQGFRREIFMQHSKSTRYDWRKKGKAITAISESAEKASRCLWIKRSEPWSTTETNERWGIWRYIERVWKRGNESGVVFPIHIYLYIIESKYLYKGSYREKIPFSYNIKICFPLRLYLLVELLLSLFYNDCLIK